ncbi:uncharacterized protein V1516DRAFT_668813 [Lipomyces oligophaga]|uniref:uncharacterized protein n=1 Tax=Lipomyces oligophaga TaxID=45792 RepID=UPI0034CDAC64
MSEIPIRRIPGWVAARIGLGVANAISVGYRSYERMQYSAGVKLKRIAVTMGLVGKTTGVHELTVGPDGVRMNMQDGRAVTRRNLDLESPALYGRPSRTEIERVVAELIARSASAVFYVKPKPETEDRIIHVYNNLAQLAYVLLRPAAKSKTWTLMYADVYQARMDALTQGEEAGNETWSTDMVGRNIATIYAGNRHGLGVGTGAISPRARPGKYVLFSNSQTGGLTYRKVSRRWTREEGGLRTFYLCGKTGVGSNSPGAAYQWMKSGLLVRTRRPEAEFFMTDPAVGHPATVGRQELPGYRAAVHAERIITQQQQHLVTDEREAVAHVGQVAKDSKTWRVIVDTSKLEPEVVLATALISMQHQWRRSIILSGIEVPQELQ